MKKTLSILPFMVISLFLFPTCTSEDYDEYCADRSEFRPREVLQRIRLVEMDEWGDAKNGWSIRDMENKNIELVAMAEGFRIPLMDKDGNSIRQVKERAEAKLHQDWLDLYMDYPGTPGNSESGKGHFVLKIDDGLWFNITAIYIFGECKRAYLKSYVFEGKNHAQSIDGGHVELIPFDEKKKREELKENYPDGFPYF